MIYPRMCAYIDQLAIFVSGNQKGDDGYGISPHPFDVCAVRRCATLKRDGFIGDNVNLRTHVFKLLCINPGAEVFQWRVRGNFTDVRGELNITKGFHLHDFAGIVQTRLPATEGILEGKRG